MLHSVKLTEELGWLSMGPAFEFDMAEGMCAHRVTLTPDYIVFSCSKLFKDGSVRKLRVLSINASIKGRPKLVLEQSTPIDPHIMVSPKDSLGVIRASPQETTIVYAVGPTIVSIKILAHNSNISWRSWINTLNTCQVNKQTNDLAQIGSTILM